MRDRVRLERRGYFWEGCLLSGGGEEDVTVTVSYGRCGGLGRSTTRSFDSEKEAKVWWHTAKEEKVASGYVDVGGGEREGESGTRTRMRLRTRASGKENVLKEDCCAPKAKVSRGMKGRGTVDTRSPLGVIDPASEIRGKILVADGDDDEGTTEEPQVFDCMLVLVDPPKNVDKFIVLQLIETSTATGSSSNPEFVVYERWGRTGTSGKSMKKTYTFLDDGLRAFKDKFEEKTGLSWKSRRGASIAGRYRVVVQDFDVKREHSEGRGWGRWQYWVGEDRVDGKEPGWYDYDATGSILVEQLYLEAQSNSWLNQRLVTSGTYTYLVDLWKMVQTNVVHANHTVRRIRRIVGIVSNDDTDEIKGNSKDKVPFRARKKGTRTHQHPQLSPKNVAAEAKAMGTKKEELEDVKEEGIIPVDTACPSADQYTVVEPFDATLNQTNIQGCSNNNKYYRMQLLRGPGPTTAQWHVWTRWGRVGESRGSQTLSLGPFQDQDTAEKAFAKKFRDKSGNHWTDRGTFQHVRGKYDLVEVDHTAKEEDEVDADSDGERPRVKGVEPRAVERVQEYLPCTLDGPTQELVDMLFEKELYSEAMEAFDVDIRRLPLGNLTAAQVQRGVDVLKQIEQELTTPSPHRKQDTFEELSSRFYTVIPHAFGRRRPPLIDTEPLLRKAFEKCDVLLDIERATEMMNDAEERQEQAEAAKEKKKSRRGIAAATAPVAVAHPSDARYASLGCRLELLDPKTHVDEYRKVESAFENTRQSGKDAKLLHIWRLDRQSEAERFEESCGKIENRKLLWHGTNIAVVAAICSSGLRIMPNAGGRVGRGIYLASENAKSFSYTVASKRNRKGCMFLVEAALGAECEIFQDDHTLRAAPDGYDSVVARGKQTPAVFDSLEIDHRQVHLAVGKPHRNPKAETSRFLQDEFLIYREEQAKIRYIITVTS